MSVLAGHPWLRLGVVDSTNDRAWEALRDGLPPGFVVSAEGQTRGRGREGRAFHAAPGLGLWASLTLASALPPARLPGFGVALGVAAAETLGRLAGLPVDLRWPNDLMTGPLKLGGILLESRPRDDGGCLLVAGLGVNLRHEADDFPPELKGLATSVSSSGGRPVLPETLLERLLPAFDAHAADLEAGRTAALLAAWRARCRTLGRPVRLRRGNETLDGVLAAMDLDTLTLADGTGHRTLAAGQVSRLEEVGPRQVDA